MQPRKAYGYLHSTLVRLQLAQTLKMYPSSGYLHSTLVRLQHSCFNCFYILCKIYIPLWLDYNPVDPVKCRFYICIYIPLWLDYNEEALNEDNLEKQIYIPLWLDYNGNKRSMDRASGSFTFHFG